MRSEKVSRANKPTVNKTKEGGKLRPFEGKQSVEYPSLEGNISDGMLTTQDRPEYGKPDHRKSD